MRVIYQCLITRLIHFKGISKALVFILTIYEECNTTAQDFRKLIFISPGIIKSKERKKKYIEIT